MGAQAAGPETPHLRPAVMGLVCPWLWARLPQLWVHQRQEKEGCMAQTAGPLLDFTFFGVPGEGQMNLPRLPEANLSTGEGERGADVRSPLS